MSNCYLLCLFWGGCDLLLRLLLLIFSSPLSSYQCWRLSYSWDTSTCPQDGCEERSAMGGSLSTDKVGTRANICGSVFLLLISLSLLSVPPPCPCAHTLLVAIIGKIAPRGTAWLTSEQHAQQRAGMNKPADKKTTQEGAQKSQTGWRRLAGRTRVPNTPAAPCPSVWLAAGRPLAVFKRLCSLIKKQWQTTSGQKAAERSSIKLLTPDLLAWPWHLDGRFTD